jgi:hypothetical protein
MMDSKYACTKLRRSCFFGQVRSGKASDDGRGVDTAEAGKAFEVESFGNCDEQRRSSKCGGATWGGGVNNYDGVPAGYLYSAVVNGQAVG